MDSGIIHYLSTTEKTWKCHSQPGNLNQPHMANINKPVYIFYTVYVLFTSNGDSSLGRHNHTETEIFLLTLQLISNGFVIS